MTAPSMDSPLLVIHDVGDPEGGGAWRDGFAAAGWAGAVHAPDLPGHGAAPAPVGGNYESADAVFFLLPLLRDLADGPPPVVVGVGANGWPAELVTVSGRASALVLVDGLGGPWMDPAEVIAQGVARAHAVAADPQAMGPPPRSGLDPRLGYGVGRVASRATAARVLGEITVPVLAVESLGSPLRFDDAADLVTSSAPAPRRIVGMETAEPKAVAELVVGWLAEHA